MNEYKKVLIPFLLQNLDTNQLEGFQISIGKWLLSKEENQAYFLVFTTQESLSIRFGLLTIKYHMTLLRNKPFILIFYLAI